MLRLILNEKMMSLYKLEKASDISHTTLNDLYNERTSIEKCNVSLLYKISKILHIGMEKLYKILNYDDLSLITYDELFDLYRSSVCQELMVKGYEEFLKRHISQNNVRHLFDYDKKLEALYLLSVIDYLCKEHDLPLVKEYNDIRSYKMDKLYVSKGVYSLLKNKMTNITKVFEDSLEVFLKHNIAEDSIYNVR